MWHKLTVLINSQEKKHNTFTAVCQNDSNSTIFNNPQTFVQKWLPNMNKMNSGSQENTKKSYRKVKTHKRRYKCVVNMTLTCKLIDLLLANLTLGKEPPWQMASLGWPKCCCCRGWQIFLLRTPYKDRKSQEKLHYWIAFSVNSRSTSTPPKCMFYHSPNVTIYWFIPRGTWRVTLAILWD